MARRQIIMQMQASDNGGAALCMMLESLGRYVPLKEMREQCMFSRNGSDPEQVCRAANHYGVKAEVREATAEEVKSHLPCMVTWRRSTYVIVDKVKKNVVSLRDPAKGMYSVTWEKFCKSYGGKRFELTPEANFERGGKRPGFIPMLKARLKPYSKQIAVLSALSCAAVLVGLWAVKLRKTMLDNVMSGAEPDAFPITAILMLAAWAVSTLIGIVQTYREQELGHTMAAKNAAVLYKKLFHMPAAFYESIGRWEIMDRLEKSSTIGDDMVDLIVSRAFGALSMILYIALMFVYNPMISVVLIIGQVIFAVTTLAVQFKLVMHNRSSVSLNERVRSSMMNGLDRIDTIKATGSEGGFFRIWSSMMRDSEGNSNGMLSWEAVLTLLQTGCSLCSSGLMLFLGAYLIRRGQFTLGALSALQSVFGSASAKFASVMTAGKKMQVLRTSMERLDDFTDRACIEEVPLPEDAEPDKLSGGVEVSHLNFRYNAGGPQVLHDVSLTIAPGEMVALVGGSGCGKSTLMKIIGGMYEPTDGSVTYDGVERRKIPDVVFHASVASVDQEVNMFAGSIRDNLKMWDPTVEDYEMVLAARDAQIHARIIRNMDGYGSQILSNGNNYSGGEKQRLELARALSQEPTLLILDEFTSALDAKTEEKVFRAIRDKHTACLIAAHRLSTVRECDKVVVIDKGRIAEMGTPAELYEQRGLYYGLMQLQ